MDQLSCPDPHFRLQFLREEKLLQKLSIEIFWHLCCSSWLPLSSGRHPPNGDSPWWGSDDKSFQTIPSSASPATQLLQNEAYSCVVGSWVRGGLRGRSDETGPHLLLASGCRSDPESHPTFPCDAPRCVSQYHARHLRHPIGSISRWHHCCRMEHLPCLLAISTSTIALSVAEGRIKQAFNTWVI